MICFLQKQPWQQLATPLRHRSRHRPSHRHPSFYLHMYVCGHKGNGQSQMRDEYSIDKDEDAIRFNNAMET